MLDLQLISHVLLHVIVFCKVAYIDCCHVCEKSTACCFLKFKWIFVYNLEGEQQLNVKRVTVEYYTASVTE